MSTSAIEKTPPCSDDPVRRLRTLLRQDERPTIEEVRALADQATSAPETEMMGRILGRSGLVEDPGDGLMATSIAVLASSTVDELPGLITVEAVRRGLAARIHLGEFDDWQRAVRSGYGPVHTFCPRVTLLVLDDRVVLGDAVEELTVEEVVDRCSRFPGRLKDWSRVFHTSPGGTLVLTTLPLRPVQRSRWIAYADRARVESAWLGMNAAIARMAEEPSTVVLAHEQAAHRAGSIFAPGRMRIVASTAYAPDYLWGLAHEVAQVASADLGRSAKCLLLDLDNTLWDGAVGDLGVTGIGIGGGYPGTAHWELQAAARDLATQGVLLAAASKNDPAAAMAGLDEHPEMLVRSSDLVAIRANWRPKSENAGQVAADLNIAPEALVFVDDNPAERAEMRHGQPTVRTVEVPDDPAEVVAELLARDDFCVLRLTDEDKGRPAMYQAEARRASLAGTAANHEDFLHELETTLTPVADSAFVRPRLVQLFAKTNQFNLSERRYSADDLEQLVTQGGHVCGLRVSDRLGDSGVVAAIAVCCDQRSWHVDNMVLSCRVFGRNVEDAALIHILQRARAAGVEEVTATYTPTDRNHRCLDSLERVGFTPHPGGPPTYVHSLRSIPTQPTWVRLTEMEHLR